MKNIFFAFLLVVSTSTNAQQYNTVVEKILPGSGNAITSSFGTTAFISSVVNSNGDLATLITKLDNGGNVVLSKLIDIPGASLEGMVIVENDNGEFVFAGHYVGPYPSNFLSPQYSNGALFFGKVDQNLDLVWLKLNWSGYPYTTYNGDRYHDKQPVEIININDGSMEYVILNAVQDGKGNSSIFSVIRVDDAGNSISEVSAYTNSFGYYNGYRFIPNHLSYLPSTDQIVVTGAYNTNSIFNPQQVVVSFSGSLALAQPIQKIELPSGYNSTGHVIEDIYSTGNVYYSFSSASDPSLHTPEDCHPNYQAQQINIAQIDPNHFSNIINTMSYVPKCAWHASADYFKSNSNGLFVAFNHHEYPGIHHIGLLRVDANNLNPISYRKFQPFSDGNSSDLVAGFDIDQNEEFSILAESSNIDNPFNTRIIKTTSEGVSYCSREEEINFGQFPFDVDEYHTIWFDCQPYSDDLNANQIDYDPSYFQCNEEYGKLASIKTTTMLSKNIVFPTAISENSTAVTFNSSEDVISTIVDGLGHKIDEFPINANVGVTYKFREISKGIYYVYFVSKKMGQIVYREKLSVF